MIPSANEQGQISALLDEMTALGVITCRLQRQDMTVTIVRDIFDIVLDGYNSMDAILLLMDKY